MLKTIQGLLLAVMLITGPSFADDRTDVNAILDQLHADAASASWETYFALYADGATFLGTDVSERWDIATFKKYAGQSKGWVYIMRERHIDFTKDGDTAWFDEVLDSQNYGTTRGSGVLIRTAAGWKIAQYNLTFTVPNDLAAGITQQIQTFEARQPKN